MADRIFVVDPAQKTLGAVESVSFAEIGIQERSDLEEWVCHTPSLLGEELLVITTEYDRFDRSAMRLDVLALDKEGCLVVVELKLELSGSLADLQAIRYAACCSTMSMTDVVHEFMGYEEIPETEAMQRILTFLGMEELPQLGDRPRIILAGGTLDDPELATAVLWLRKFEVDITCVELTPYRLPGTAHLMLVPRVIIPLPEAKEYVVSVEKKDAAEARPTEAQRVVGSLWKAVCAGWNAIGSPVPAKNPPSSGVYQLRVGRGGVHYEWELHRLESHVLACLHFESNDVAKNLERLRLVEGQAEGLRSAGHEVVVGTWSGDGEWTRIGVRVPWDKSMPTEEAAQKAVSAMKAVFDATWPIVKSEIVEGEK